MNIAYFFIDIFNFSITETAMGVSVNAMSDSNNNKYVNAIYG